MISLLLFTSRSLAARHPGLSTEETSGRPRGTRRPPAGPYLAAYGEYSLAADNAERVFPISPELAHVLAQIIDRVRSADGMIPRCSRYDTHEHVYGPPLPHLFQRPIGSGHQVFSPETVRKWLERTLARAPLNDTDGTPLRFTPHDFRRLFATGAVNTGLPIHIAAALLGHRNLNTTQGYTAVYPDEVIRTYQAFIHDRRAERPTEEYREPTEAEWAEFERHFTLRKVAYGNCDRPYGTPCAHANACVRCSLLRPDPAQRVRLKEICDNLEARIIEAKREGWLGEVEGLQVSYSGVKDKLAQIDATLQRQATATKLGMPTFAAIVGRDTSTNDQRS